MATRQITKAYGRKIANLDIDFEVMPGEIHALLGENGSGKTTLLSVLYGLIPPDRGRIFLDGRPVRWRGPHDARQHGLSMVPQQFRLVPTLTVAENVVLAVRKGAMNYQKLIREVTRQIDALRTKHDFHLDPNQVVANLSVGERQRAEILRALYFKPRVLFLDEPTSVLTPHEADELYSVLEQMASEEGLSIVITTHRITEVLGRAYRITVLRNGRRVEVLDSGHVDQEALVRAMIGDRTMHLASANTDHRPAERTAILRVEDLTVDERSGRAARTSGLREVSLQIAGGEILGIAGVEGNGQLALEYLLAGLLTPSSGRILLADSHDNLLDLEMLRKRDTAQVGKLIAYIPSDRNRFGVAATLRLGTNLLLHELAWARALSVAPTAANERGMKIAGTLIREFEIDPPDPNIRVRQLSGGNAQKVVLARELSKSPRIVVAAQPTAGLDVAAASLVRKKLREQAERGSAVLVISSDLAELLDLSDSIRVMFRGRLGRSWLRSNFDSDKIGAEMAGLATL